MPSWSSQRWRRDSNQMASEEPGAIHAGATASIKLTFDLDHLCGLLRLPQGHALDHRKPTQESHDMALTANVD